MKLKEQMEKGLLFVESGHSDIENQNYAKELSDKRKKCKEVLFDYNNTRPSDYQTKDKLLRGLLGSMGERVFIESPVNMAYGCNVFMGTRVYANFNLVIVDDINVNIGNRVMFGPSVTISATGHPVYPEYRFRGAHFSLPVNIKDGVWVGANTTILPGVTIGENSVIGAGSVVTKDIPPNSLAMGVPCKVIKEIGEREKEYYYRDMKINHDFDE